MRNSFYEVARQSIIDSYMIGNEYKNAAIKMLKSLSSDQYQCGKNKPAFLLHSTGHLPNNSEIDAAIIYADYYYIEALVRLKNLIENKAVI